METIAIRKKEVLEVSKKIAYGYCKRMHARTGLDLFKQLMQGVNLSYSLEDMMQDIGLVICTHCNCNNSNYYIISDDTYTHIYKTINNRVYRLRRNSSNKTLYIEIDGQEVSITDVMGMVQAMDDDTRWYALMLYDSMVDGLSADAIDTRASVDKRKLHIYGYQRIIEGRAIKDCDYNYVDQWLKRHRGLFDL